MARNIPSRGSSVLDGRKLYLKREVHVIPQKW